VDSLLIFNNTQKLLAGFLALVLVAGMTTPAFAGIVGDFDEECPDDCEALALELLLEEQPSCGDDFDSICEGNLGFIIEQCIRDSSDRFCPSQPIGGTVGSLDTATLLVAGAQANMGLWSLALVGMVAAGAAIIYKTKSKKTEQ